LDYEQLHLYGFQFVGYANTYTWCNSNTNGYTDAYSSGDPDTNSYSNANAYSYTYRDTYSGARNQPGGDADPATRIDL